MQVKTTFVGGVVPAWAAVPGVESAPPEPPTPLKPKRQRGELAAINKAHNQERVLGAMKGHTRLTQSELAARLNMTEAKVRETAWRLMIAGKVKRLQVYTLNRGE